MIFVLSCPWFQLLSWPLVSWSNWLVNRSRSVNRCSCWFNRTWLKWLLWCYFEFLYAPFVIWVFTTWPMPSIPNWLRTQVTQVSWPMIALSNIMSSFFLLFPLQIMIVRNESLFQQQFQPILCQQNQPFGVNVKYIYPFIARWLVCFIRGLLITFNITAASIGIGGLPEILHSTTIHIAIRYDHGCSGSSSYSFWPSSSSIGWSLHKTEIAQNFKQICGSEEAGLAVRWEPTALVNTAQLVGQLAGPLNLSQATGQSFRQVSWDKVVIRPNQKLVSQLMEP